MRASAPPALMAGSPVSDAGDVHSMANRLYYAAESLLDVGSEISILTFLQFGRMFSSSSYDDVLSCLA